MNILLVDDDRFVVSALEKKIDWSSLADARVFTAYNVLQAEKIMRSDQIDICVCDIEMPGKSGLDLLAWVREEGFKTQFIFLTSYADFSYAQKAITLSSLDYQLKPIDFQKLYQILQKAVGKVQETAAQNKTQEDSRHWRNNYRNIVDLFWKDLFKNPVLREPAILEKELKRKDLPYNSEDCFLPVLIKLYPDKELWKDLEPALVDFSFFNITEETLQEACILYETIITLQPYEYIILISGIHLEEVRGPLNASFRRLFSNLKNFLKCDFSCCISQEVPLPRLPEILGQLRSMREENLNKVNTLLFLSSYVPRKSEYMPPSMEILNTFLEQKDADTVIQNLKQYLETIAHKQEIGKEELMRLKLDMEQMVFSYLQKNGIEAHTLFGQEETSVLESKSLESISYMMSYLKHILVRTVDYSSFVKEEKSVVDLILDYIRQHYSEDITRTMLADMVFLNPDYMARLFKKQTGSSVVNYITVYRIEKAKEFLHNSSIPVSAVASKVGYGNYSYFSKLFKDVVGCTPNEYRKNPENP